MSRTLRYVVAALCALAVAVSLSATATAQRHATPRHGPPPHSGVVYPGHVFIGGYFYDPYWGPYPWWPHTAYPYWYFPMYEPRAEVHVKVTPKLAAVYVDGFYAGIVDDFDGMFQSLPLTSGGHTLTFFLEGFRTAEHHLYLGPGSSFTLHDTLQPLASSERSEPPALSPPVPPPPEGSFEAPRTPPRTIPGPPPVTPGQAIGYGTIDLRIQPPDAEVAIDGQRWLTTDHGRFAVQLSAGVHHVAVAKRGYQPYAADIEVHDGQTTPLNVGLAMAR